jgi:hypothetical protein
MHCVLTVAERPPYPLTVPGKFDILQSDSRLAGDRMQFDQLKRRKFITLLGGAVARPRRLGLMGSRSEGQRRIASWRNVRGKLERLSC